MSHPDNWIENFFDTVEGHIRYFRTGGDKPSILLLHGGMDNSLSWTRVAKSLESEFDIIMPDARGHGKSISYQKEFTYTEMISDTVELIEYLKIAPTIVIGHSMGAHIATELGARYPHLVRKL
ncbi:MAG: alpha/beta fold hydrolase, partial [Promethearchaeota archaeon]